MRKRINRLLIVALAAETVVRAMEGKFNDGSLSYTSADLALSQHRIKTAKRFLKYSSEHPWQRRIQKFDDHDISSDLTYNLNGEGRPRQRHLTNDDILEEYLSKSQSRMWSTVSLGSSYREEQTNSTTSLRKSVRIRAALISHDSSGVDYLTNSQRVTLLRDIIRPALNTWSDALSVVPVQGNLTIDQSQLYDGESCGPGVQSGLPSVVVPLDHFEDGIRDTDLMVYVNVGFHGDLLEHLMSIENSVRDLEGQHTQDETLIDNQTERIFTIDDATTAARTIPSCSGTYLASSTYCSTDQFDRPVAGMLHLCLSRSFFHHNNKKYGQVTVLHELGHILGFNSQSLAHFRDKETGEPLTPRDANGDVIDKRIECTGVGEARGFATVPLPSMDILRFHEVRGGQRVAHIVTPNVRQVARNHFDCQSLQGAELESYTIRTIDRNQTDFFDQCISDHWERRLFKADIMNPIVDSVLSSTHISPLTLAYFMDSGWYDINVTSAAEPDTWGRAVGCSFVNDQCIAQPNNEPTSEFFCAQSHQEGCSDDMLGKAVCSMVIYNNDLPFEYRYFDNHAIGGGDPGLDFCPSFVGSSRDLCSTEDSRICRLEEFGTNSRCLTGKASRTPSVPLCVPIACVVDEKVPYVRVDKMWEKCEFEGQVIQSWYDDEEFVICPDPVQTCPSFYCPRNCLNDDFVGVCDYDTGVCNCPTSIFLEPEAELCDVNMNFETANSSGIYVNYSSSLESDEKGILDFTKRMFIQMNAGEVLGFVATSLITIGACFIIFTCCYRCVKQRSTNIFSARWHDKEWHVDTIWQAMETSRIGWRGSRRSNKDKMVASILHNMRVDSAFSANQSNSLSTATDDRIFYRSEMPPLPGAVRIVTVVGAKFIDDSLLAYENEDDLTIDGTFRDSVTSNAQELDSHHCTAMDECIDEDSVGASSVEQHSSRSGTRRRLRSFPKR